jgi:transcriptional regulator with XRE-family HTH domain
MSEPFGPAVARERLRTRLRELREQAGMSADDVARALDWPASTVGAIEDGTRIIHSHQIATLLGVFGQSDPGLITDLSSLAIVARSGIWWERHGLTGPHQQYLAREPEASRISVYQPLIVPGLLQTRAYALAATAAILDKPADHPDVLARVEIRRERQRTLEARTGSAPGPILTAVLEEAVLSRPVGGRQALRRQLDHLLERVDDGYVALVVTPTDLGGHVGLGGVFELLEFDDSRDADLVFIESAAGDYLTRDPDITAFFRNNVDQLRRRGTSGEEATALVRRVRASLPD